MDEKRQFVYDELEEIDTYHLTGDINEVAEKFVKTIYRLKKEYEDRYISLNIDYQEERYSDSYTFCLKGKRLETDKEYNDRVAQENDWRERRREQYEALKKEFEKT